MKNKPIGNYISRKSCRFCESTHLISIMDFGDFPLAGGFLKQEEIPGEKFYPLKVNLCKDCYLVQISEIVSKEVLFNENYFFFSSSIGTLVQHFRDFASEIYEKFLKGKVSPSAFELGCNDGVLLKPLAELGVRAVGIDPATNVVNSIKSSNFTVINDFFGETTAKEIEKEHGKFDIFLSSYSFAHIDDMIDIMRGVKYLLKDDGILIIEIYYLGTLIDEMQYDMIYHEHMSYYSLKSLGSFLKKYDMEIFDLKFIPGVRSGSVRFFARNVGKRNEGISKSVFEMMEYEEMRGFNSIETYKKYALEVEKTRADLLGVLDQLKSEKKSIIGYGASGRGTIIMNYCGIDSHYIDYVVDDAPAKHGYYTPGTNIPIKSWDYVKESKYPDYAILFAWAFTEEVIKKRSDFIKQGGKFIIPLPKVRIFPELKFFKNINI